ncbi:helix-turn-helix transcriptional regulator [Streptomyces lavendulae]|uniref:helix-turn-helix domain-containing protein n=1 Tax=Streptomyces lavendulae TaxID=1914 RepID=UPI00340B6FAF
MFLRDRDRCVDLMRVMKVSQRTLADRARVSQPYVSLMLRGKRGAKPETAWRIASALGVDTDELFATERPADTKPVNVTLLSLTPDNTMWAASKRSARMKVQPRIKRNAMTTAA